MLRINQASWTLGDVLAAVPGLDEGRLQHWLNRGPLTATVEHKAGSGRPRRFTALDAVLVATMHALTLLGVPVSLAWRVGTEVRQRAAERAAELAAGQAQDTEVVWLGLPDAEGGTGLGFMSTTTQMLAGGVPGKASAFIIVRGDQVIKDVLARLRQRAEDRELTR